MFVEGITEQVFADTVLKPHLANHCVYLHSPVLVAHANKGRTHRGGGRRFDDGRHTASKRTVEQIPAYERLKTSVGPQMTRDIGLPAISRSAPTSTSGCADWKALEPVERELRVSGDRPVIIR